MIKWPVVIAVAIILYFLYAYYAPRIPVKRFFEKFDACYGIYSIFCQIPIDEILQDLQDHDKIYIQHDKKNQIIFSSKQEAYDQMRELIDEALEWYKFIEEYVELEKDYKGELYELYRKINFMEIEES